MEAAGTFQRFAGRADAIAAWQERGLRALALAPVDHESPGVGVAGILDPGRRETLIAFVVVEMPGLIAEEALSSASFVAVLRDG
jgi:hypothetical protein